MRYFDGQNWTNHFHEPGKLPDIGSWINTTFSGLMAHWQGAAFIAFVVLVVSNAILWFSMRNILDRGAYLGDEFFGITTNDVIVLSVLMFGAFFLQLVSWLALSRFMQRAHLNANPTIGDAFSHALRRLPMLIGYFLLLAIATVGAIMIFALLTAIAPPMLIITIPLLIVGMFWALVKFAFFIPAIVAVPKGQSPIGASMGVSSGRFWPVLGRVLLLSFVPGIMAQVITGALGKFGTPLDPDVLAESIVTNSSGTAIDFQLRFADLFPSTGTMLIAIVVSSLIGAVTSSISASGFMRLYLDSGAPNELAV